MPPGSLWYHIGMDHKNAAFVYCITNTVNGKRYVGVSRSPESRWRRHLIKARGKPEGRQRIHHAISKYGPAAFTFEVLACARTWDDALATEVLLIKELSTHEAGYNRTAGGEGVVGLIWSDETRAKHATRVPYERTAARRAAQRLLMKGRKPTAEVIAAGIAANKGRKLSAKTKAAMSASRMGRAVSEATREKLRLANLGVKRSAAACEANRAAQLGKKHTAAQSLAKSLRQKGRKIATWTDARRAALSAAQKGKKRGPLSDATRAAISAATKGRKVSPSTRAKLRAANLAKKSFAETGVEQGAFAF